MTADAILKLCLAKILEPISKDDFVPATSDTHTQELVKAMLTIVSKAVEEGKIVIVLSGFVAGLCEGKIQRSHNDLDIVIQTEDIAFFKKAFGKLGYTISHFKSKNPDVSCIASHGDIHVDVGGIEITQTEIFDMTDKAGKYTWPIKPEDFLWMRQIEGIPVYFISPKIAHYFKQSSGRKTEKDEQDLSVLSKHLESRP